MYDFFGTTRERSTSHVERGWYLASYFCPQHHPPPRVINTGKMHELFGCFSTGRVQRTFTKESRHADGKKGATASKMRFTGQGCARWGLSTDARGVHSTTISPQRRRRL
ncbi:unnamed protein product, partial [Ectocarpus sp. 12 AP-2014]